MGFSLIFSPTPAGHFALAAVLLAALKLIAAAAQFILMRGNYRDTPDTVLFRIIYATGKITPTLAIACVLGAALLLHASNRVLIYGVLTVLIAILSLWVVRLRKQGKFFGVLDLVQKNRSPKP